uniref:Uncharacterized protein n=1 Tax=Astatotilapia calliptera TaxID=8154 RepID=A0AAX7U6Y8_ASTCA
MFSNSDVCKIGNRGPKCRVIAQMCPEITVTVVEVNGSR